MAQRSHVPKFGNWEGEDNVPYTVYFDKARKDRTGGKMINPNDPQENPGMFPNMPPPAQAQAPAPAPPARREPAEPVVGRRAVRPTHEHHSSKEDVVDLKQYAGSPAHGGAAGAAQQRRGAHGSGSGRPVRTSAGSEQSIDRSPLHPHYQAKVTGGRGSGSPAAEGKNSYESSHGTPGRSRMKPNRGDESPDKGAAVPRFGEWDENNPSSADNYTHIFNKVREARHNVGSPQISMENESSYNNGGRQRADGNRKTRCFGCFG
ncbi:hypothetical protein LguiA_011732 [Lonicera macranthoides]